MSGFAPANVRSIVATDCGSTTTKAILIEKQPDGVYRLVARGEAPTTVEAPFDDVTMIGSGGNINKLFKMTGKQQDKPLTYLGLNAQYAMLNKMTYDERISELALNPDRADVIIPATKIYLNAMKWSGARHLYVPKIGLSDGIVKAMYYGRI